jgi:chromosome segregation ATPase
VNQTEPPTIESLQTEVSQLRDELQLRDQLLQQLSQELFRLVKGNAKLSAKPDFSQRQVRAISLFGQQIQDVEQQVALYQQQIDSRDTEIENLRDSVQQLTTRSQMLERLLQQLPQIYQQKFAERLIQVRDKVATLQRENRQLAAKLQSANYRIASRNPKKTLELPNIPRVAGSLPPYGNIDSSQIEP